MVPISKIWETVDSNLEGLSQLVSTWPRKFPLFEFAPVVVAHVVHTADGLHPFSSLPLHSLAVGLLKDSDSTLFLPVGVGSFQIFRPAGDTLWAHGQWHESEGEARTADITLFDEQGNRVAFLGELRLCGGFSSHCNLQSICHRRKSAEPRTTKCNLLNGGNPPRLRHLYQGL